MSAAARSRILSGNIPCLKKYSPHLLFKRRKKKLLLFEEAMKQTFIEFLLKEDFREPFRELSA